MHPIIQSWLFQSAVIFLMVGSVAGMWVGALLVFRPQSLQVLSRVLNRWISTRTLDKSLETSFTLDPWLYRHRRGMGAFILIGALFVLYFFTLLDRPSAIEGLAAHFHSHPLLVGGLLDALVLSVLLGSLCAVFVALSLMFRPSLLRGFEGGANQWVSLRKALKPMEIPRDNLERYVAHHSRQVGLFLLLGGLYTLLVCLWWWLL